MSTSLRCEGGVNEPNDEDLVVFSTLTLLVECQEKHVIMFLLVICLQCFDAVGWAAGRASDL